MMCVVGSENIYVVGMEVVVVFFRLRFSCTRGK
jgi:hypothetical protein